jgi:hypothetical protein
MNQVSKAQGWGNQPANSFFNQTQPNQRKAHIVYVDTDNEEAEAPL